MAEVLFYQLTASPLEASLPDLLERSLARGWRVVLRCGSEAGLAALDAMLWTYRDDAFLPHGTAAAGQGAEQPVYLTLGEENPNGANVLMLVDGARAAPAEMAGFERTCLIFDGHDAAGGRGRPRRLAGGRRGGAAGEILGAGAGEMGAEGPERLSCRDCSEKSMHNACTTYAQRMCIVGDRVPAPARAAGRGWTGCAELRHENPNPRA